MVSRDRGFVDNMGIKKADMICVLFFRQLAFLVEMSKLFLNQLCLEIDLGALHFVFD